jgi:endonuclease G
MVLPAKKGDAIGRVTNHTRLIGVIMPNEQSIDTDWPEYRVSVDEVEALTGFDFFSELPDDIETEIESITDDIEVD